jgi:hypothetical protein
VNLVRLRRPKITCSPSCAIYRSKINVEILLDLGHTTEGDPYWKNKEREENLNLNVVDVCTIQEQV